MSSHSKTKAKSKVIALQLLSALNWKQLLRACLYKNTYVHLFTKQLQNLISFFSTKTLIKKVLLFLDLIVHDSGNVALEQSYWQDWKFQLINKKTEKHTEWLMYEKNTDCSQVISIC